MTVFIHALEAYVAVTGLLVGSVMYFFRIYESTKIGPDGAPKWNINWRGRRIAPFDRKAAEAWFGLVVALCGVGSSLVYVWVIKIAVEGLAGLIVSHGPIIIYGLAIAVAVLAYRKGWLPQLVRLVVPRDPPTVDVFTQDMFKKYEEQRKLDEAYEKERQLRLEAARKAAERMSNPSE